MVFILTCNNAVLQALQIKKISGPFDVFDVEIEEIGVLSNPLQDE
jgi:hypothetical protein